MEAMKDERNAAIICHAGGHDGEHALLLLMHYALAGVGVTLEQLARMRGCQVQSIERRIRAMKKRGWITWEWALDPETGSRQYRFAIDYERIARDLRGEPAEDAKPRKSRTDPNQMPLEYPAAAARQQRGSSAAAARQQRGSSAAAARQQRGSNPESGVRLKERARDHGHGHGSMVHGARAGYGRDRSRRIGKRNAVGGPCIANIADPGILGDVAALRRLWRHESSRGSVGDTEQCTLEDFVSAAVRAQQVEREEGGSAVAIFAGIVNQRGRDPTKPRSWWRLITKNQRRQARRMLETAEERHGVERVRAVRAALHLHQTGRCPHPYIVARDQCGDGLTRDQFEAISGEVGARS